jgi:stearoyl-CoA desaturase (delta-9 desaturase)
MNKLNWYFYKIYLPIQLISILGLLTVFSGYATINWYIVFITWFLIGPVGIGVGFHRLFSHRQFKTYRPVEYILALLGTLSTYGPVLYWVSEHQHHHKYVDTDRDVNSPKHGFWHSFLYWRFTKKSLDAVLIKDRCSLIALNDKMLCWMSKHYVLIVYSYLAISLMFGLSMFVSMFVLPILIEQIRLNILNSIVHMKLPGSYQNFPNEDSSYNNVLIGYLTFGFGWHNNHHHNPRELVNSHHWYEIDIEGLIGKALSKKN